jgi:hypothetical protein
MIAKVKRPFIFSDMALSRRLERAEARSNADFVEARARAFPSSGATWVEVAGAYAMYDGVTSPLTQTFGLGMFETATVADLERIEKFFGEREAPVFHEISPLADISLLTILGERGYHPIEFTSVMFRPLLDDDPLPESTSEKVQVRLVQEDDISLWVQTAAKGWSEFTELAGFMDDLMQITANRSGGLSFLAELEGQAIGAGAMTICDGVALLAGASTIPEFRRQGAQLALLSSRLQYAAEHGCDIAMMCAQPGSGSQRNAERHGFRIAYTRVKWRLGMPAR